MGPLLKLLVVALLTLPAGAFVLGHLSAEPDGPVPQRAPVVLEDPLPAEPARTITSRSEADEQPKRSRGPGPVKVIGPRPTELEDDEPDEGDDADEREEIGDGKAPSPGGRTGEDDSNDREVGDREDDDEAEPDEPESDGPEDDETTEPEDDEESDAERDEEDDEADDD